MDWLDTITSLEFRHTPETLYASARLGLAEMIKSGATSALGMADQIGSLEEGKLADIIILDDGGLFTAPMRDFDQDDVVKRLVSAYQSASLWTSIIDGQIVMEERKLLTMD
jgi:cytosine/adenosine deaminase-related metal-dependent hydrolase